MEREYSKAIVDAPVVLFVGGGPCKHLGRPLLDDWYRDLNEELSRRETIGPVWEALSQDDPPRNVERILQLAEELSRGELNSRTDPEGVAVAGRIQLPADELRAAAGKVAVEVKRYLIRSLGELATEEELQQAWLPFMECVLDLSVHPVLPVFTTNYDLVLDSMAACAAQMDAEWKSGFKAAMEGGRAAWSPDRVHAVAGGEGRRRIVPLKLHGSLHWEWDNGQVVAVFDPSSGRPLAGTEDKAVIWPALGKAVQQEPFATAYAYLGECLRNARLAVFVGYGFQDEAVMRCLRESRRQNARLRVVVVDPCSKQDAFRKRGVPWDEVCHMPCFFGPDCLEDMLQKLREYVVAPGDALTSEELTGWTAESCHVDPVDKYTVRVAGEADSWKQLVSPRPYGDFCIRVSVRRQSQGHWAGVAFRRIDATDWWGLVVQSTQVAARQVSGVDPQIGKPVGRPPLGPGGYLAARWMDLRIEVKGRTALVSCRWPGSHWMSNRAIGGFPPGASPIALVCWRDKQAAEFRNVCIREL